MMNKNRISKSKLGTNKNEFLRSNRFSSKKGKLFSEYKTMKSTRYSTKCQNYLKAETKNNALDIEKILHRLKLFKNSYSFFNDTDSKLLDLIDTIYNTLINLLKKRNEETLDNKLKYEQLIINKDTINRILEESYINERLYNKLNIENSNNGFEISKYKGKIKELDNFIELHLFNQNTEKGKINNLISNTMQKLLLKKEEYQNLKINFQKEIFGIQDIIKKKESELTKLNIEIEDKMNLLHSFKAKEIERKKFVKENTRSISSFNKGKNSK